MKFFSHYITPSLLKTKKVFSFPVVHPAKNPKGNPRGFLPRPLLRAGKQPRFCESMPPESSFAKPSPFQISSSGLVSKKVRILYNEYRNFWKSISEPQMWSARSAVCSGFPPLSPASASIFHAPRGSSFANTIL